MVATTELGDEHGNADPVHGVWLAAGTDVDMLDRAGPLRELVVRDGLLAIRGWVSPGILGDVWTGELATAHTEHATSHVAAGGEVREAPSTSARVLATARVDLSVAVRGVDGDWQDVRAVEGPIRVRGFVPTSSLLADAGIEGGMSGGASGYGISDTERLEVPEGACLFDRADGRIIGVNLVQRERYASEVETEWPSVYVDTLWGLITVTVHQQDGKLASCKPGIAAR